MAGHRKVRVVMMAEGTDESAILTEIEELATEARVPIRRMHRDQIDAQARTEAPQGVIAQAAELREADADELLESHADRPIPFILALDGLTDPRNLGALLRSADGAGVTGVLLPRHRAVHVTRIERLSDLHLVHVQLYQSDQNLVTAAPAGVRYQPGESVGVELLRPMWFDADGQRIAV